MKELDKTIFEKRFEYHIELTRQRWQYFAVNLVLQGTLLNFWKDFKDQEILIRFICSFGIISTLAFVVLIGRARRRIRINAEKVNEQAKQNILETGKKKSPGFSGVTIWLILTTLVLVIPWFCILWELKEYYFFIFLLIPLLYIIGSTEFLHDWTIIDWIWPSSTKAVNKKHK
ncbi:MAG: hypothetical protein HXX16_01805 [Bacteroidales bacterium]|nr:hypothetical protein [Bacteroidales bacterium]